jgi:hypothetical protein
MSTEGRIATNIFIGALFTRGHRNHQRIHRVTDLLRRNSQANQISEVFLVAQSFSANGMALHLVKDRQQVLRISPSIAAKKFDLDSAHRIPALKGLGDFEARKALPELRKKFFGEPVADDFIPFHKL